MENIFEQVRNEAQTEPNDNSFEKIEEPTSNENDVWSDDKPIEELIQEAQEEIQKINNEQENNFAQTEQNESEINQKNATENISTNDVAQEYSVTLKRPLIYRGKEIYPTEDELIELAQKGLDYSFKMNKIKPYRELIELIKDVDPNYIKTFIDALNGDENAKEQISNILNIEKNEFDVFDNKSNIESNNIDKQNNKQNNELFGQIQNNEKNAIANILRELDIKNPELYVKVRKTFDSIDDGFKAELMNPKLFIQFIGSVSTGEFDKVYPDAIKIKALNPHFTWLQSYIEAYKGNLGKYQKLDKKEPSTELSKEPKRSGQKTIKQKYDEIWDDEQSIEELEKMLIEEI